MLSIFILTLGYYSSYYTLSMYSRDINLGCHRMPNYKIVVTGML